jgi:hypothetical protein
MGRLLGAGGGLYQTVSGRMTAGERRACRGVIRRVMIAYVPTGCTRSLTVRWHDMAASDQDYTGDYGYDLVHEARSLKIPVQRTRSTPAVAVRGVPFEVDPDGDFGYDMAHER